MTSFQKIFSRSGTYSPIALELDGVGVRAIQLVRSRAGKTSLHAMAEFVLPSTDSDRTALRNILQRRNFEGDDITICAPARLLESDLLQLPDTKSTPTAQSTTDTIRGLLSRATRTAAGELEVAYWSRASDSGPTAYAVALRHAEARKLIQPFESAGFNVLSIGCAASATAELLHHFGHADTCSAVLRLGHDAHILVLCLGREVIYQRTLDAAGWKVVAPNDTVGAPFRPTPPVRAHLALISEETSSTLLCVPRTFGTLDVKRLLVAGEHAESAFVLEYLRQTLPAATPLDLSAVSTPPGLPKLTTKMDVALGLALAEVSP